MPRPPAGVPRPAPAEPLDPGAGKAPSVFVSPNGSDAGACTEHAPCGSFARAYAAAVPGEVVEVAGGRYGQQMLAADPGKRSSDDVVFRPAERGAVEVEGIVFGGPVTTDRGASHVTVRDMEVRGFVTQRSRDLTLLDVTIRGSFAVQGGGEIALVGGSVGGVHDGSHPEVVAYVGPDGVEPPRRVLVDGVLFHDVKMSRPEDHVECLQVTDAIGLVVRNSRFAGCDTFDLRVDRYRTRAPRDVVIENNLFHQTTNSFGGAVYYGLAVRAGAGVVIRNNSSDIGWAGPEPGAPATDWLVVNNAMPGGACDDRISFRRNVWKSGERCSPGDLVGDPLFADAARGNFRLRAGSPAIDAADPDAAPAVDFEARRRGARPDIGALER